MSKTPDDGIIVPVIPISSLRINLPFYQSVSAGFPSPAEDYYTKKLNLHDYCVKNPAATFFVEVQGDSMIDAGICDGAILVVDRSLNFASSKVIIAYYLDGFLTRRLVKEAGKWYLKAENPNYPPIEITEHDNFLYWGTVTFIVQKPL